MIAGLFFCKLMVPTVSLFEVTKKSEGALSPDYRWGPMLGSWVKIVIMERTHQIVSIDGSIRSQKFKLFKDQTTTIDWNR